MTADSFWVTTTGFDWYPSGGAGTLTTNGTLLTTSDSVEVLLRPEEVDLLLAVPNPPGPLEVEAAPTADEDAVALELALGNEYVIWFVIE